MSPLREPGREEGSHGALPGSLPPSPPCGPALTLCLAQEFSPEKVPLCCACGTPGWVWAYLGAQPGPAVSVLAHRILLPLLKQSLPGLRTGGPGQRLRPHQLPAALPLPMGLSGGRQLRGGGRLGWRHERWAEERTTESGTQVQLSLGHTGSSSPPSVK